ncbi:hypothetical protein EDB81DRAFT_141525 [Dactylonectria macrodidyma]|uniref:Ribonuclease H n=1 Tax=Dactylonectria macrodidyma TaxID=307937 RepID=A0A9P9IP50_9HYPO|nr:hypothetical protein EDB81DRAFT_141525 [Dactylonectria macrodidyma]
MKMKFYAVAVGRETGIFETWDKTSLLVTGFKGAIHKAFSTREAALEFLQLHGSQSAAPKPFKITTKPISIPNETQTPPVEARRSRSDAGNGDRTGPPGRKPWPQSRNGGAGRSYNHHQTKRKPQSHTELALNLKVSVV